MLKDEECDGASLLSRSLMAVCRGELVRAYSASADLDHARMGVERARRVQDPAVGDRALALASLLARWQ